LFAESVGEGTTGACTACGCGVGGSTFGVSIVVILGGSTGFGGSGTTGRGGGASRTGGTGLSTLWTIFGGAFRSARAGDRHLQSAASTAATRSGRHEMHEPDGLRVLDLEFSVV
jgi:hypothetical protein